MLFLGALLFSEAEDADGEGDESQDLADYAADGAEADIDIKGKPADGVAVFPRAVEVDAFGSKERADSAEQGADNRQCVPKVVSKRKARYGSINGIGDGVCDHKADCGHSLELAVAFLYEYVYNVTHQVDYIDDNADAACVEEVGHHKQEHTYDLNQEKRYFILHLEGDHDEYHRDYAYYHCYCFIC